MKTFCWLEKCPKCGYSGDYVWRYNDESERIIVKCGKCEHTFKRLPVDSDINIYKGAKDEKSN